MSSRITKVMLDQLEYDTKKMSVKKETKAPNQGQLVSPTILFVFGGSDINAAIYHLSQSLQSPLNAGAIATVLVQESIRKDFIEILQQKLTGIAPEIAQHAPRANALETIKRLNFETITAPTLGANSPVLVSDVTHEQLGPISAATGIVTLHTFRTAKEAIGLSSKESLKFVNASIWNENHSCAYEIVAASKCENFFINCWQVPLDPVKGCTCSGNSFVTMDKSYHYETLLHNDVQKSIVFPIGTVFAN